MAMFTRKMLALVSAVAVIFTLVAGSAANSSAAKTSNPTAPAAASNPAANAAPPAAQSAPPPSAAVHDPRQRRGIPPPLAADHPAAADISGAPDYSSSQYHNPGGASSLSSDWQQLPGPPAGPAESYLYGVSMPADNYGWAVGSYGYNSMIEHWDGANWSVFYTGTFAYNFGTALYAVDSLSTSEAYAVGYADNYPTNAPFIMHWDGSSWSEANTGLNSSNVPYLYGVKEISSSDVWAVGYSYGNGTTPVTFHYDGSSWSQITAPNPTGNCYLQSVAGSASNAVWAAGYCYGTNYNVSSLILRWNGSAWTQDSTPGVGTQSYLNSVVSVSPTSAWAFGYSYDTNYNENTLVLHWNGSVWTQQNSPNGNDASVNELYGATAVSPTELWAVGNGRLNPIRIHTTDGGNSWVLVNGPGGRAAMTAVAASSATNVMAVGCSFYCYHTRVEHWDGSSWSLLPNYPIVGVAGVSIGNATALDANHAWAVGEYYDGNPLIFTWDGGSWSAISTTLMPAGASQTFLYDVSAAAPNDVWAVGQYLANYYTGMVLHFDGNTWTQMPGSESLSSVAALAPNNVWGVSGSFIRHYDGNGWSTVTYPQPSGYVYLSQIRARAVNDIWAVGYSSNNGQRTPLALHYTGSAWQLVPAVGSGFFSSVMPISANEAWAGGANQSYIPMAQRWSRSTNHWTVVNTGLPSCCSLYRMSGTGSNDIWAESGGLTVHWNGTTWAQDFYYPPNANFISDQAVASFGNQDVWVLGSYGSDYSYKPLIAVHPANVVPSPTPTPTTIPTATPTLGPYEFYDVPPGSLWYPFVHWLAQQGIVSGTSYGYYSPNANTTRAQFTKMVVAGFGYPLINPPTPYFSDVPTNYWAYQFIETAHAHNVIGGYSQAQCAAIGHAYPCFGPNDNITRAQIVIIVVNAKGWTLTTPGTPTFSDVPANSFAYAAVETAVGHGVIGGYSQAQCVALGRAYPCFGPNNNGTRGQLAKILYLTLNAPNDTPTPTATATMSATITNTPLPTNTPMVTDTPLPILTPTVTPTP